MFDNYIKRVSRARFEEIVAEHQHPYFDPEGPYITSNEIRFTCRFGRRRTKFIASLEEKDYADQRSPYMERQIMAAFNRMVKYPKYDLDKLPGSFDVKQYLYSNPAFNEREIEYAILYDVNSAFGNAERGPIPDTDREYTGKIKPGDIGIRPYKDTWIFITEGEGFKNFPLIEWNAGKFVDLHYARRSAAKLDGRMDDYEMEKIYLNHHVGSMKYHNQIIRSWIIWQSNNYIKKFIDSNTIMCNTDSIISSVNRDDIPIGEEIGQFSIDDVGRFYKSNFDYQFYDTGKSKVRGLPVLERGEGFDLAEHVAKRRKKAEKPEKKLKPAGYNFVKGKFEK